MKINLGPMLNAYPDSLGGTLSDAVAFLQEKEVKGAFSSFYILPSLFNTDLDRGFSVIDYGINGVIAKEEDLEALQSMGIDLKLDFILNHLSVQSPQFQDLVEKGDASAYKDFFIDWNKFWEGCGDLDQDGVLVPRQEYIKDMFFRKPGLPVLVVEFADGTRRPYWNTFYQQVDVDENGKKHYLGQMDLNIKSPLVLDFYRQTLADLAGYGASIVRLDAFAYAPKEVGSKNFLNDPGTWDFLQQITDMAKPYGVSLLRSMPFLTGILLNIYQAMGMNWERMGNVRFAVVYKPGDAPLEQSMAQERSRQIAREWSAAMEAGRDGRVRDFVAVGDVDIKVIGADNQVLDSEVPVRQILEQFVARTGIPPFLLGLSWSSTERMSTQQADMMTSELTAIRRGLEPVVERICELWLALHGFDRRVTVDWEDINLQDLVEEARAELYREQAEELRLAREGKEG